MADLLDPKLLKKERMKRLLELQGQWSEEQKQRHLLVSNFDFHQSLISNPLNHKSSSH